MRLVLAAISTLLLSACSAPNATWQTALGLWQKPEPVFAKGFEYLEIGVDGRQAFMALASRQMQDGAVVERWFSGRGEMLELRDGRIHQVLGMTREVRATQAQTPSWRTLLSSESTNTWQRSRQVMPGYQQRADQVRSQRLEHAPANAPGAQWVEEQISSQLPDGREWHYRECFAIQQERVVYSEQCISHDLCFKLKPLGIPQP